MSQAACSKAYQRTHVVKILHSNLLPLSGPGWRPRAGPASTARLWPGHWTYSGPQLQPRMSFKYSKSLADGILGQKIEKTKLRGFPISRACIFCIISSLLFSCLLLLLFSSLVFSSFSYLQSLIFFSFLSLSSFVHLKLCFPWPPVLPKPYETNWNDVWYAQIQAFTMGSTWSKTRATKDPEGTTRGFFFHCSLWFLNFTYTREV